MRHHNELDTSKMKVLMTSSNKGRYNMREISVSDIYRVIRNNSNRSLSTDESFLMYVNSYKNEGTRLICYYTTDSKQYWKEHKIQDTSYHAQIGCVDVDFDKNKVGDLFKTENGREGSKEEVKLFCANMLNRHEMFTTNIRAWFSLLDNAFLVQRSSGGGFKVWFCCDEITNREDYKIFGMWITKQTQECFRSQFPDMYDLIEWDKTAMDINHGQYDRAYMQIVEYNGDHIENHFDLELCKELYREDVQKEAKKIVHACVNMDEIYVQGGYGKANCTSSGWNLPLALKEFGNVTSSTYFRNSIGTGFRMNNVSIDKTKEIVGWYFDRASIEKFNEENNLAAGYAYSGRCSQVIVNYVSEIVSEYNQVHKREEHVILNGKYLDSFWSKEESEIIHYDNGSDYFKREKIVAREDTTFWKDVYKRLERKEKIAIEAPMGAGKSFGILNFIYKYFGDKKIIYMYPLSTQYSKISEDWARKELPRITLNNLREYGRKLPDRFFCNFSSVEDLMGIDVLTKEVLEGYTIIVDEVQMALSEGTYRNGIFKVVSKIKKYNTGVLYLTGTDNDILAGLNLDYKWSFTYDKKLQRKCNYTIVDCMKSDMFVSFVIDTIRRNEEKNVKTVIFCNAGNKALRRGLQKAKLDVAVIKRENKDINTNEVVSYVKSEEAKRIEKGYGTSCNAILFTSYFSVGSDLFFQDKAQEYDFICVLDDVDGTNIVQAVGRQRDKTLRNIYFVNCPALIGSVKHGQLSYSDLVQLEKEKKEIALWSDALKKKNCVEYLRKSNEDRVIYMASQLYYENHRSLAFILKLLKFNGYDIEDNGRFFYSRMTKDDKKISNKTIIKATMKFCSEILKMKDVPTLVAGFKLYRKERDGIADLFFDDESEGEECGFSEDFKAFFDNNNQEKILETASKMISLRNDVFVYVSELLGHSDDCVSLNKLGDFISKHNEALDQRRIYDFPKYDFERLMFEVRCLDVIEDKNMKFFLVGTHKELGKGILKEYLLSRKLLLECVDDDGLAGQCRKEIPIIETELKKLATSLGGRNSSAKKHVKMVDMEDNKEYDFDSKGDLMKSLNVSTRTFSKIMKLTISGNGTFENKKIYKNHFRIGTFRLEFGDKCA